ncbi:hypothetical protein T310_9734, partial [Rasamsonia emersonii CBS 393.64]
IEASPLSSPWSSFLFLVSDDAVFTMPRDRYKERLRQADLIHHHGFPVDPPCHYCERKNQSCIMDSKSRNCAACTRRGRKCEKRFHSDKEWNDLLKAEQKIDSDLLKISEELARLHAKQVRLLKQKRLLRERGSKMLEHDSLVMEQLDEEDPLGIPPDSPIESEQNLAALSEVPNLTESQINEILRWSPNPSELVAVGGILESSHGNSSSS